MNSLATLRAHLNLPGRAAPSHRPTSAAPGTADHTQRAAVGCVAVAMGLFLSATPAQAAPANFCPPGSAAGQCNDPNYLAVDQSSGTVYVADFNNNRIDEFDSAGHFIRAFGVGVINGANELQTCTTVCIEGHGSQGDSPARDLPGAITPRSVAVDPASHEVYVNDGNNFRVEKFNSLGKFQLMSGGGVLDGGATGTGDLTAGSATVTSVATTSRKFAIGQTLTAAGIPAATRIANVNPESGAITLSQPATASGTGVALTAPTPAANNPNNEVETIALGGAPTGGTFTLTFFAPATQAVPNPQTATAIPFNASAAQLQAKLEALTNIGAGNVAVSGSAGGPWTVEFKGRYADTNNLHMDANGAGLTPFGSATVTIAVEGASAPETCTEAELEAGDSCHPGVPGSGAGQFGTNSPPIAFDAAGNVWAGDINRLEQFSPAGAFLSEVKLPGAGEISSLAIDPTSGDFYTLKPPSGERNELQAIIRPPSGEYTLTFGGHTTEPISFEASGEAIQKPLEELPSIGAGNVSVRAKFFQVFFKGAFASTNVEQITASGGATVETITQGSSGTPGVLSKLKPNGELIETLDSSGHPAALALDPAGGNLFVSDQRGVRSNSGNATLLSYDASGAQTEAFGSGEVIGGPQGNALAFGDSAQALYVVGQTAAQIFTLPPPGPLPGTAVANPIGKTSATLTAEVNPEGHATTYHFQYVDQHSFETEGGFAGPHTVTTAPESASIGEDFAFHPASKPVSSLQPATAYRFRLVATNECEPVKHPLQKCTIDGETASFQTLPPAAIDSTSAAEVSADSATLEAEINPLGDATSYRFEYLTAAEFEANLGEGPDGFSGAHLPTSIPVPDAPLGAGSADVSVSQHLQSLLPHTAYRYRVVIRNAVSEAHGGPFGGPVHAFTTQAPASLGLPDARAWEQVSPPDKHGANLLPIQEAGLIQAGASGDAIAYKASAPTEAQPPGNPLFVQVLSARGGGGWASRDIAAPHSGVSLFTGGEGSDYSFFSADLSRGILQPSGAFTPSISPAASEQTPFLRTDFEPADPTAFCTSSCYRPIVSGCPKAGEPCPPAVEAAADVPPGTEFGEEGKCPPKILCGPGFGNATPDLSHVVLGGRGLTSVPGDEGGSYEWTPAAPPAESLRLITVLPNGQPAKPGGGVGDARNAISADGSRVVWGGVGHLYLRYNATEPQSALNGSGQCTEPANACTIQLDALQGGPGAAQTPQAVFQLASTDGSRLFFVDSQQLTPGAGTAAGGGDLYECRIVEVAGALHCDLTDLTPASGGESAAVQGSVIGAAADGASLYFVATGVLTGEEANAQGEEAQSGQPNLYLRHDGTTKFIATLSGKDSPDWDGGGRGLNKLTARVSPDGRWLAFMSQLPLSGYDNRDAVSGERDQEVFLYHAASGEGEEGELHCASCNPSGARPHGVPYGTNSLSNLPLAGGDRVWEENQWLAANLPGWTPYSLSRALHQSRYLSDGGRLFFNSSDALVPADTNGQEDVYQYEPPQGEGAPPNDTCTPSSPTYSRASEGCVDLITSGASAEESAFLDASESGNDVFFLTAAQLAHSDTDTSLDVYDARAPHVPGEAVGFPAAVKPVECSGDACQQPAVPPNDPTPGSLSFHGAGNVHEEEAKPRCAKGKVKRRGKCVAKHHPKKHNRAHKRHQRRAGR